VIIVGTGSLLNTLFTERIPLILAWLGGFAAQAVIRHFLFGEQLLAALTPMTGLAFVLFTFYMVTDPGTTPSNKRSQAIFGASVAAAYGVLVALHVVFGLFFALSIVTIGRGLLMHWAAWRAASAAVARPELALAPVAVSERVP